VWCHYMLWVPGISDDLNGFVKEMQLAKSYGIDGFALNTAQWNSVDWAKPRVALMLKAAEQTGFKLFMSADVTVEFTGSPNGIVDMIANVSRSSAYYKVNGAAFLSTFVGQSVGWNWQSSVLNPLQQKGVPVYFVPFFDGDPQGIVNRFNFAQGFFHWTAWPYNGNLQVVDPSADRNWRSATANAGKVFMAPVSPYFAKHYCGLPADAKPNWVFGNYKGPGLWIEHWQQLISIGPDYIEIVTWNDYPEASYIGPITAQWGISDKCNGNGPTMYDRAAYPHDAYGDLGRYFIEWYKNNAAPQITQDKIYVFYRLFPKNQQCNDPTGLGPVQNGQSMDDDIYVVSLLKSAATVTIHTGGQSKSFDVKAGLTTSTLPFATGSQSVTVTRNNAQVGSKTFSKQISNSCTDGNLYDMNTFSDFFSF